MKTVILSQKEKRFFKEYLCREEKSKVTIEKFIRDVEKFYCFADGRCVTKELVISYKEYLVECGYAVRSINSMLSGLNQFLQLIGLHDCKVKQLRLQREVFCSAEREISRSEYLRLLNAAKKNTQIWLVLQTICSTGIRVSELQYFTVENLRKGRVTVSCKNKSRIVFFPAKLIKLLLNYAAEQRIQKGSIYISKKGTPLSRNYIWIQMKKLCKQANVNANKVYPHNLRKLFAKAFYEIEKDIARLADILGHSNIETTRIYIMTSGIEHQRKIEQLRLLL